jgi:hypothetical protein
MTLFGFDFGSLQPYLPYALGGGLVTGLILALALRRRKPEPVEPLITGPLDRPVDWEAHDTSFADRRGSIRREGKPVRVLVSCPVFKNKLSSGWVIDRSTGGLRLALEVAVAPGTGMQVRAVNAPDTIPWVTVLARSCRDTGDYFELGCEFEQTPPWNVLLLFG